MFQQNAQEINWWLELVKIIVPSAVALIVPLLTYLWLSQKLAIYQTKLSRDLESHKRDMSKEIEVHKFQLQSDFYKFQTLYSSYHNQKADAVRILYGLLAEAEFPLRKIVEFSQILLAFDTNLNNQEIAQNAQKQIENSSERFEKLYVFYNGNNIYFDEKMNDSLETFIGIFKKILEDARGYIYVLKRLQSETNDMTFINTDVGKMKSLLIERSLETSKLLDEIVPLKKELQTEFKRVIEVQSHELTLSQ